MVGAERPDGDVEADPVADLLGDPPRADVVGRPGGQREGIGLGPAAAEKDRVAERGQAARRRVRHCVVLFCVSLR
jgi:hypothetical protein